MAEVIATLTSVKALASVELGIAVDPADEVVVMVLRFVVVVDGPDFIQE